MHLWAACAVVRENNVKEACHHKRKKDELFALKILSYLNQMVRLKDHWKGPNHASSKVSKYILVSMRHKDLHPRTIDILRHVVFSIGWEEQNGFYEIQILVPLTWTFDVCFGCLKELLEIGMEKRRRRESLLCILFFISMCQNF